MGGGMMQGGQQGDQGQMSGGQQGQMPDGSSQGGQRRNR